MNFNPDDIVAEATPTFTREFSGKVYKFWDTEYRGENIRIAQIELEDEIFDEDGDYASEEMAELDESISFFVLPDETFNSVIVNIFDR